MSRSHLGSKHLGIESYQRFLKIGLKSIGSINVRLLDYCLFFPHFFYPPKKEGGGAENYNELAKPVFNKFFLVIHSIFTENSTMIRLICFIQIYIFFYIIFILSMPLVKTYNNWLAFTYFCKL